MNANKDKLRSLPRRLLNQEMVENEEMWIPVSETLLGFVLYKFPSQRSLSGSGRCETADTPSAMRIWEHLELSELKAEPQVVYLLNTGATCVIYYLYDFTLNYLVRFFYHSIWAIYSLMHHPTR